MTDKVSSNSNAMRYATQRRQRGCLCILLSTALCCALAGTPCRGYAIPPALGQHIAEVRERHNIPVVAVSRIVHGQPMESVVIGAAPSTPLRWGSITKTITALTVLAMAEEGLLSLQAPLGQYLDPGQWRNPWRQRNPVRVIDLLEMRAGFTDLSAKEFAFNQPITLHQALALDPDHRVSRWPPGSQHVYSNMTAGLTQLLIETIAGMPYAAAAQHYALGRLGMENAGFSPLPDLPGGYQADGTSKIPYWHMTYPAYGALNASLAAMNQLLLHLCQPQRLPALPRQHLFSPHGRRWGQQFVFDYAAGLYPRVRRGHVWHTHGGDADGYRSRLAVLADGCGGYLVNINTDNPRALIEIESLLEADLTRNRVRPEPPPVAEMPAAVFSSIAGRYYPTSTRFALAKWQQGRLASVYIEADAEQLTVTRRGSRTVLYPVGPTLFRRAGDPVATVTIFSRHGRTYMQGELGNFERVTADAETHR